MIGAYSRFWLAINREIHSRISRLTWSAWYIKIKERHWRRHNGGHGRRLPFLSLRCDRMTLCLYSDLGHIKGRSMILKLWNRFRMRQNSFKLNMGQIRHTLFASADTGIHPHLSSQYYAWPSVARGIAMLRVDKFPYQRKQGVTYIIPRDLIQNDRRGITSLRIG